MNFFKTIFLLSLCLFVFTSCEKEKNIVATDINDSFAAEQREILDYFDSKNYNLDSVQFRGDMVFYESDIAWYRSDLMKTIRGEFILENDNDPDLEDMVFAKDRQQALADNEMVNAITSSNVKNITYFIRPSVLADCGVNWFNVIAVAAADWTGLSNCRVNIGRTFVESSADIIIGSDIDTGMPLQAQNLPFGVTAIAAFPMDGVPGRFISINASLDWMPKKRSTIIHEMGHTLGFWHTGTNEAQRVHGTPANESGSVMNLSQWNGGSNFKPGDIRMARMFYPDTYNMPTNFNAQNLGGGELGISYRNPANLTRPYYWIRLAVYNTNGNIISVQYRRSTVSGSNNSHNFILYGWKGTYLFALRGCNFRRDVWSPRTPRVLVNF